MWEIPTFYFVFHNVGNPNFLNYFFVFFLLLLSRTEVGKYASYCSRALERAARSPPFRQCRPSRLEVLSVMLKNPDCHSLPHALPVHFPSGDYRVVGFDGSSSVAEFSADLCADLGFRAAAESGFALYSDDPIEKGVEHALHPDDKVEEDTLCFFTRNLCSKVRGGFPTNVASMNLVMGCSKVVFFFHYIPTPAVAY